MKGYRITDRVSPCSLDSISTNRDKGYRKPDTYAEVFEILSEEKVIPKNLLRELKGMAAFRNVLVHDYLKIDHDKVYAILHERLPYIEKLGTVFGRLI